MARLPLSPTVEDRRWVGTEGPGAFKRLTLPFFLCTTQGAAVLNLDGM
ncbi:MAG: hypothetical protein PHE83_17750 [Opitutaceae bacterium]|nr:hypothetical protein [Opitutaceae bacterium]